MSTVFFDVDTQLDFLFPAGALYVPGAEQTAPALASLTKFAVKHQLPIVSTLDTHTENDPEFHFWKPHCVAGTQGRQKWSHTLVEHDATKQILFEKNTIDFFPNPRLDHILDELNADRFVVYGLVTEYCICSVIFGLLERGVHVELVTDGIRSLDAQQERAVFERFTASGGHLISVADSLRI